MNDDLNIKRQSTEDVAQVVPGRWIPVTERMPEPFQPVIVCRKNGKGEYVVGQGFKDVIDCWRTWGSRVKNVTHWMPLPEPPDVGEKVGDAV